MSILVEGMKMPQDKEIYLRIDEKGEVYVYGSYPTELHKAVSVPPHGRLFDERDILKNQHDVILKNGAKHRCFDTTLLSEIRAIIEAEEDE